AGWRNDKHAAQWGATLATYAYPLIGELPVQAVDVGLVLKVLEPIWTEKPETASRLRGRIESVLDYAKVRGWRDGENPARWRGHMDNLLAPRAKVRATEHHAAMPYADLPAFMKELRRQEGVAASALEFLILTAARTGEAIGARWSEIDTVEQTWTIRAGRMKASREHRVPLSAGAVAVIEAVPRLDDGANDGFVFPGAKSSKPLSNMALLMLLRRMDHGELTAHGFRATFKTWASERTAFQNEIIESSLAHVVGGKVEQAYMRGDLFDKRRQLMTAWADYCAASGGL
ncbi:MAG: tyrosine-type recombinase/integrase, partial [Gemmataceae bacterium]